jgi:hypothetical protein
MPIKQILGPDPTIGPLRRTVRLVSQAADLPRTGGTNVSRFDLETWAPFEQAAVRARLDQLLSDALQRSVSKATVREVLDALFDDHKEFRKMKRRTEWSRL